MKVVVARVMENNILRGFATVDSNTGYTLVKLDDCSAHVYCNAKYDFEYRTLVGTQGSLTKYPTLDISGKLATKNGLAIVSTDGVEYIGFDALGKRYNLDYKGLMKVPIKSNFTCENGNVLSKGLPFIYTGQKNDDKTKIKTVKIGQVGRGDALLRASANIKKVAPYYSYCLDSVKRKSTNSVERFACTEDTVFWNNDYCETISVGQITFGFLHEILHIVMLHAIRGRGKNHKLWNIATDLYINSILMQNFGLYLGCEEIKINNGVMALPENIITMESIGETIDLKRDTPESIYKQLVKENPEEDEGSQGQGNGNSKGGNSSSDDEQSDSSDGNQNNGENGKNGKNNSQNGSSDGNDDSSSTDGSSGDDFSEGGTDEVKENDFGSNSQSEVGSSSGSGTTKEVTVRYHGKIIKGVVSEDIYTNNADPSPDAVQQNIDRAKEILQNIKTSVAIAERDGHSVVKNAMIEREIDFGLAMGVDWRNVLRKYCNRKPKKTFTLGNPNRDYMTMGMTLADRHRIGKNEGFEDIKIAIDVSGSVSKKQLDYFLSEVSNIFRYYKTDGELIYWSDTVNSTGRFKDVRDLLKIKPKSGISTNVYGVFDYVAKQGKRPACIVIITDGYFSQNYAEFAKYFGNNTIWLIYGNARQFTPCFGRVIQMEDE